jgi:hypothetical protein
MNSTPATVVKMVALLFLLTIPASVYGDEHAIEAWNNVKGPYAASIYNYAKHKLVDCERPAGSFRKCSLARRV